jgi:hypothetical protein
MLDRSDPRASLASYGAGSQGGRAATEVAPAEYVRFYGTEPQEVARGVRTWYARGQHFVLAYSEAEEGAELSRDAQPDEHVLLLPDPSAAVAVQTREGSTEVGGGSISFLPPGEASVRVAAAGRLVRLFTIRSADLAARCSNAASYERPHPNVGPLEPWPEPAGGLHLRTYSLAVPAQPGRFGRIFRCTTFTVNCLEPHGGPRDTTRMSPHSHDDFEQCSLALEGEFVHHLRYPWTADKARWREDEHARIGSPSMVVIPPPSIHTSEWRGDRNLLVDVFCPPRLDFSRQPGWVLNEGDYPTP